MAHAGVSWGEVVVVVAGETSPWPGGPARTGGGRPRERARRGGEGKRKTSAEGAGELGKRETSELGK